MIWHRVLCKGEYETRETGNKTKSKIYDQRNRRKNLKEKVKWVRKPNKENFDDRNICYKKQKKQEI